MPTQDISFLGSDALMKGMMNSGNPQRVFDWDKAAKLIKARLTNNPEDSIVCEAGLAGDWNYTGGEIFRDGKPVEDSYTYLSSNWATPLLTINDEEIECWCLKLGQTSVATLNGLSQH